MALAMDTRLQNFWKENIHKEEAIRFAWQLRYSKQFSKKALPTSTTKAATNAKRRVKGISSSATERIRQLEAAKQQSSEGTASRSRQNTAKGARDRLAKSDGALSLRDMRPPSSSTRQLLFEGISSHGNGRYAYLKKRKMQIPEEKYDFPILSSCQYGWKIRQFTNPKPSPHARACIIKNSFYRNSGIIMN